MKPVNPNQPFAITGLPAELLTPAVMRFIGANFSHRGLSVVLDEGDLVVSFTHPPVAAKGLFKLPDSNANIVRVKQALRSTLKALSKESING